MIKQIKKYGLYFLALFMAVLYESDIYTAMIVIAYFVSWFVVIDAAIILADYIKYKVLLVKANYLILITALFLTFIGFTYGDTYVTVLFLSCSTVFFFARLFIKKLR